MEPTSMAAMRIGECHKSIHPCMDAYLEQTTRNKAKHQVQDNDDDDDDDDGLVLTEAPPCPTPHDYLLNQQLKSL
uniref:Uncharacterized protein n=1 Tax=Oryza sativa subsp. japonica TaxID=39947 RepID=Q6ZEZ6_ORYSJ|nr:hypothetical protein [Oryza sativa Japonica Group]